MNGETRYNQTPAHHALKVSTAARSCAHWRRRPGALFQGWKMASKNLAFLSLKNLQTSKVQNLGFSGFFIFWSNFTDHIKFHILIVICEFC